MERLLTRWAVRGAIPLRYNELVQAAVYASLPPDLACHLHNRGYSDGRRVYRPFVFSRLLGPRRLFGDAWQFAGPLTLVVASPFPAVTQALAASWLSRGILPVGPARLALQELRVEPIPEPPETICVRALSPITVHTTVWRTVATRPRRWTHYLSPFMPDFATLCLQNLRRKYTAFCGPLPAGAETLTLTPLDVTLHDRVIVMVHGLVVKGWLGRYRLSGPPALLRLALAAGLGDRNPQGFGLVVPDGAATEEGR